MSYQDWYNENRDALLERRKQKYANDPEFRAAEQKRRREALAKKRQERLANEQRNESLGVKPPHVWKAYLEQRPEGVVAYYTCKTACAILGLNLVTLRSWLRKGFFRRPENREFSTGAALYGPEDLAALRKLMKESCLGESKHVGEYVALIRLANGETRREVLFKLGGLSARTRRSPENLTRLEHRKCIPETPFLSPDHRRLFTETMACAVDETLREFKRIADQSIPAIRAKLEETWKVYRDAQIVELVPAGEDTADVIVSVLSSGEVEA